MAFELFRAPFAGSELYGRKPDKVEYPTSSEILAELTKGNLSAVPAATELADKATKANLANITRMFQSIPGFDKLSKTITDDASAGPLISQELADYIQNSTAANALGRGVGGSGFQRNLFKTGLIREGISETNRRLGAAERWISSMAQFYQPGLFNIANSFLSTSQQMDVSHNTFLNDVRQEVIDAAPDPVRVGREAKEQYYLQLGLSFIPGAGGSPGGSPGGGGGGGGGLSGLGGKVASSNAMAGVSAAAGSGMFGGCWIAREVFGNDNPKWIAFWAWKEFVGPVWFRSWYAQNGELFARWIADKPAVKSRIKHWMLSKIS